ncbi:uncharacterized protein F4812DRAFT_441177 [Daldinia caldariorum]|uniref:uncharacterized protein n=1 Tax=Daldinia caldariorum TaxID=326644 RepID=UPI002008B78E|nr:uncharacterized protein F4812DRAFT_441177 [Daldinia caldariorum]KAI1464971.1 hypothetical protein F4812DRAFT_441177 [Daldinia caldariorum]
MSSKRKFSEFTADSSEQDGSNERVPGTHAPNKFNNKKPKKNKAKPDNISWLKKRARTIERRLKMGKSMPANVEIELERELAHHQQKIAETVDEKKRKTMIKKYHMVRFFERKKADRLAKQIKSQLNTAEDPEEIEKLKADLHKAEIDGIYARYFPYRERYISLYPVGEKAEDGSTAAKALRAERPPLWKVIEEASEKGTSALVAIRERKLEKDSKGETTKESSKGSLTTKANQSKAKNLDASDRTSARKNKGQTKRDKTSDSPDLSDNESEGGFFE